MTTAPMFRRLTAVASLSLVLLTAGCGTPPWLEYEEAGATLAAADAKPVIRATVVSDEVTDEGSDDDEATPTPSAPPTPTPEQTPTPEPEPVLPPFENVLASGSVTRVLEAGTVSVELSYWSTLSLDQWTASAQKPLSLRLTADGVGDVSLAGLRVVAEGYVEGNWVGLDPGVVNLPALEGTIDVSDPASTIQAIVIGPVEDDVTALRLTVMVDLLDDDRYTSAQYSALDSLSILLAQ